jgi:hypothetical protein
VGRFASVTCGAKSLPKSKQRARFALLEPRLCIARKWTPQTRADAASLSVDADQLRQVARHWGHLRLRCHRPSPPHCHPVRCSRRCQRSRPDEMNRLAPTRCSNSQAACSQLPAHTATSPRGTTSLSVLRLPCSFDSRRVVIASLFGNTKQYNYAHTTIDPQCPRWSVGSAMTRGRHIATAITIQLQDRQR